MTYIKINEKLAKYTKEEFEDKVRELEATCMKKSDIYRELGVSAEVFRRHVAILKDPEGYAEKQAAARTLKGHAEANKGIKALEREDAFWQKPEDALEKFRKEFKERKRQIALKESRDPYY